MTGWGLAIIHYGDPGVTTRTYQSALAQIAPSQILIVANSPLSQEGFPESDVIHSSTNIGYGAAVNMAARAARERDWQVLVISNNDVEFVGDSLIEIAQYAMVGTSAAVGPLVLWGHRPTIWALGGKLDLWRMNGWNGFKGKSVDRLVDVRPRRATFLSGCCLAIRVSVLVELPFSESLFLYGEDMEWCERLAEAGLQLAALPTAIVRHFPSTSVGFDSPAYLYYTVRNRLLLASHASSLKRTVATAYVCMSVGKQLLRHISGRSQRMAVWSGLRDGIARVSGVNPWLTDTGRR